MMKDMTMLIQRVSYRAILPKHCSHFFHYIIPLLAKCAIACEKLE